jgi:hypothetical protein
MINGKVVGLYSVDLETGKEKRQAADCIEDIAVLRGSQKALGCGYCGKQVTFSILNL